MKEKTLIVDNEAGNLSQDYHRGRWKDYARTLRFSGPKSL